MLFTCFLKHTKRTQLNSKREVLAWKGLSVCDVTGQRLLPGSPDRSLSGQRGCGPRARAQSQLGSPTHQQLNRLAPPNKARQLRFIRPQDLSSGVTPTHRGRAQPAEEEESRRIPGSGTGGTDHC